MGTFPRMAQIHSPELFERVLREVATHGTISAAARAIGVEHFTVANWAKRFPEFGAQLREALADGIEAMADDVLRIVDGDDLDDEVEVIDAQGRRGIGTRRLKLAAAGGDPVARARLRAETRLKLIAARAPERYGNKVLHAGHDGGAIKHEQAIDIRAIAAQLRSAAAARTIDHDATPATRDSAQRFERDGSLRRRVTAAARGGVAQLDGDGAAGAARSGSSEGGPATTGGRISPAGAKGGPTAPPQTGTGNSSNSTDYFNPEDYV